MPQKGDTGPSGRRPPTVVTFTRKGRGLQALETPAMVSSALQAALEASQPSSGPSLSDAPTKRAVDDPYEFLSSDEDQAPTASLSAGEAL